MGSLAKELRAALAEHEARHKETWTGPYHYAQANDRIEAARDKADAAITRAGLWPPGRIAIGNEEALSLLEAMETKTHDLLRFTPNGTRETAMDKNIAEVESLDDLPLIVVRTIEKAHARNGAHVVKLVKVEQNPDGTVDVLTEGIVLTAPRDAA